MTAPRLPTPLQLTGHIIQILGSQTVHPTGGGKIRALNGRPEFRTGRRRFLMQRASPIPPYAGNMVNAQAVSCNQATQLGKDLFRKKSGTARGPPARNVISATLLSGSARAFCGESSPCGFGCQDEPKPLCPSPLAELGRAPGSCGNFG